MSRSVRGWLQVAGLTAIMVAVPVFIAWNVVMGGVTEFYSPGWYARSSTEAAARGLLRARPVVVPRRHFFHGDSLTIDDAWVEQATHVEYRWYLLRREIRDPRYRLVLRAGADWQPTAFGCDRWLAYGDSTSLGMSGWSYFIDVRHDQAFPDTVRLVVVRSPACETTVEPTTVSKRDDG